MNDCFSKENVCVALGEAGLLCLWLVGLGCAQEFKIGKREVQVHGFASQGFVYTDQNNWLTMNTSQGSGAMTDMGLNLSSQLTDRLRVGAQVYDHNLGQLGQWHPSLDWGLADYRFRNWFGVRGGKVKTTLGSYNDTQDLDFLRVFAMLPQGIYPADLRDISIAHTGGDIYGNFPLGRHGDVSYTAYIGHRSDSVYSGYPYLIQQWGGYLRSITGLQYGADVRWSTPVKGLKIGASRLNQDVTAKGSTSSALNSLSAYQTTSRAYWTNQFYGEYQWRKVQFDSEYRRVYNLQPVLPGSDLSSDMRAWYVSGTYRITKYLGLGSYYSHYTETYVSTGLLSGILQTQTDPSLHWNHVYDKAVAARVDINRFIYLKIEGHFMDGYGIGPYPNGFYPQQNPQGFRPTTNGLIVKTGFHF